MTFRAGKQRNSMRKALSCIFFPIYRKVSFQTSTMSITVWFKKYLTILFLSNQPLCGVCVCLQVFIHTQRSAHFYIHTTKMLKLESQKRLQHTLPQVCYYFSLYQLETLSAVPSVQIHQKSITAPRICSVGCQQISFKSIFPKS